MCFHHYHQHYQNHNHNYHFNHHYFVSVIRAKVSVLLLLLAKNGLKGWLPLHALCHLPRIAMVVVPLQKSVTGQAGWTLDRQYRTCLLNVWICVVSIHH